MKTYAGGSWKNSSKLERSGGPHLRILEASSSLKSAPTPWALAIVPIDSNQGGLVSEVVGGGRTGTGRALEEVGGERRRWGIEKPRSGTKTG